MVSNAEPQRTLSNAEIVDLFPLRFSTGGVYPARFRVSRVPHHFRGMAGRLRDDNYDKIY